MNVLVWFKRDLRVADHPALALAAGLGPVLPLYIVEPDYWRQPDAAARHWAFIAESLAELRAALGALGAPLVVRVGEAVPVLERLCRANGITRIVSHEETGNLWTFARDRAVADWARREGVEWCELPQQGVTRDPRGGATVLVIDNQNKAQSRSIEIGQAVGDSWLATKGLQSGDRVIIEGLQRIQPGMTVRPVPAGSPPRPAPQGQPGHGGGRP